MPRNDGVRLDDHQRRSPSRPDPREPYPEEPVRQCQPRSLHGPLQDAQLVTECQDVKLQSRAAAEHQDNGREEGGEYAPGRQSMEEAQVIVYQSDLDLREPQGPILTRYTCGCIRRCISRLTKRGHPCLRRRAEHATQSAGTHQRLPRRTALPRPYLPEKSPSCRLLQLDSGAEHSFGRQHLFARTRAQ